MKKVKKICVVTGTRAEYGLLYWFMKKIKSDKNLRLQIIVTGMHVSTEFGLTINQIKKDKFLVDKKIEMLLSADTPSSIAKSTGLGMIGFADALNELNPDLLVVLGDRFEILSACYAATILRIPIAHFHGGEATEGLIDEPTRHSITKMSHIHFVANKIYKKRVIQLGENPRTVHLVGGMGIDNINKLRLLNKKDLERKLSFKLSKKNLLVTFHPVTLEKNTSSLQMKELLNALQSLKETNIIFTKPNSDTEGRIICKLIDDFVKSNPNRSISFISMGQVLYLSSLKQVDAIIGNSSSGLIEAPSFKIGTINIGERQKGRIFSKSVINCEPKYNSIKRSISKLYSKKFQASLKKVKNPYGEGGASQKSFKIIKKIDIENILKKNFFDLNFKN